MIKNESSAIIPKSDNMNIIGCSIVLRNKYNSDGTLERRKVGMVAKWFIQRPGVDLNKTVALVARLESSKLLRTIAAECSTKIHQMDVTTAYLSGEIGEEIYMEKLKFQWKACLS